MPRLGQHVFLAKRMYHLVAGAPGSGKSSLADQIWVLDPVEMLISNPEVLERVRYHVTIRSLERSQQHRIAKWVCQHIWQHYRILMDVPFLFSWGQRRNWISDDHYTLVREALERIEQILEYVTIIDGGAHPTEVYRQFVDEALKRGTYYRMSSLNTEDGSFRLEKSRKYGEFTACLPGEGPDLQPYQTLYIPDDPNLIHMAVLDHIGKVRPERSKDLPKDPKSTIDLTSARLTDLRDTYGYGIGVVQQMNRNVNDPLRRVRLDLQPEESDLAGSSVPYQDCDVCLAVFDPMRYSKEEYKGYQAAHMNGRFRSMHLIKNTYGVSGKMSAALFVGEVGRFTELSLPDQLPSNFYENVRAMRPTYELENATTNRTGSGGTQVPENSGDLFST